MILDTSWWEEKVRTQDVVCASPGVQTACGKPEDFGVPINIDQALSDSRSA